MNNNELPIIIAITGASGVIYGLKMLEVLKSLKISTIACISENAYKTLELETSYKSSYLRSLPDQIYDNRNLSAPISSGSFLTRGMIVAPCSIKTLSSIANSYNDTLITRSADVCLKERRTLTLMVRETPLHANHLKMMANLNLLGANIIPPLVSFYHAPKTIDDIIMHSIGKCFDQSNIKHNLFKRWS